MRVFRLALPVLILTLIATPAVAGDWGLDTWKQQSSGSDWEGFGVGTTYTTTMVSKTPMGPSTTATRHTLMKIEADKFTIKVEHKLPNGQWMGSNTTESRKKKVKFETVVVGQEAVVIAGTSYTCNKIKGTKTEADGKQEVMHFWEHADEGVLQYALKMQMRGAMNLDMKATVSKLSVTKKIGSVTLKCREFKATMKGMGTQTMLVALNAPVSTISQASVMTMQGMSMTSNSTVTALVIKPLAATTK